MADIVIQGGDAKAAAQAMSAALREIFETDPILSTIDTAIPGSARSLELLTIILTVPITAIAATDLLSRAQVGQRWRRLITRAEKESKTTSARLLIDLGDGKPIPLHQANREKISEALAALENRAKT